MDWLKARWAERSSWDGVAMIVVGAIAVFATPFVKWAGLASIVYGAWRVWEKD